MDLSSSLTQSKYLLLLCIFLHWEKGELINGSSGLAMIPSLILLIIMINYDLKFFNEISCSPLPAWSLLFANKQLMLRWMRNLDMLPCHFPGYFLNREIVDRQSIFH